MIYIVGGQNGFMDQFYSQSAHRIFNSPHTTTDIHDIAHIYPNCLWQSCAYFTHTFSSKVFSRTINKILYQSELYILPNCAHVTDSGG